MTAVSPANGWQGDSSGSSEVCCDGIGGLTHIERVTGMCLSFVCFCTTFLLAWLVLQAYYGRFRTMSIAIQADNCSRVNSTIHSLVVVPSLLYGLISMPWGESFQPLGDVRFLQAVLCITIGYFACDMCVLVLYKPPQWAGFAFHHAVASTPYLIYYYVQQCPYGLFVFACFMLVEFTNVSLNTQAWLQQNEKGNTPAYAVALYTTFFGWMIFRLVIPTAMLVVIHKYIMGSIPANAKLCLVPGLVCAYIINIFCYAVFYFILVKEVRLRWNYDPDPLNVAELNASTRPVDLDDMEMSLDEQYLIVESPSRMLIAEAKECIRRIDPSQGSSGFKSSFFHNNTERRSYS